MKSAFRALALAWLCVLCMPHTQAQPADTRPALMPHVDERVELFSVVFRLAGNPEYRMDTLPKYAAEIDRYFGPYKDHAAVRMAAAAREKYGVSFDAVMAMAISVSQPPELKPLVSLTNGVPDERWRRVDTDAFLQSLRDFYRDTRFAEFYAAHRPMYAEAESRFARTLDAVDLAWYPAFYGSRPSLDYHVLLGMNNGGGNYGPRLLHPDGRADLFSIIGCWTHDDAGEPTYPENSDYESTIIHEFNHSFVNPVVAEHWSELAGAEPVFQAVKQPLRRWAYGDAQTMVDESLVRAAVILYFRQAGESQESTRTRIREEQRMGFFWMDQLVDKLSEYEAQRDRYATLSSFMPQIAQFYAGLGAHSAELLAALDARSAHVVRLEPFANHAVDVDPALKQVSVVLDKPLNAHAGYSILLGDGGKEHYPVSGPPVFEKDGAVIVLPLGLKPKQSYSLVLSPLAFITPDGYPLVEYTIDFKTR